MAKLVLSQNPGQPMSWPGWPVATALNFIGKGKIKKVFFFTFHSEVTLHILQKEKEKDKSMYIVYFLNGIKKFGRLDNKSL